MSKSELTAARLRELFWYDPETGWFERRITTSNYRARRGCIAGTVLTPRPGMRYVAIHVDGKLHYAHRLAWLYVYGAWPPEQIDHINGHGLDNRVTNLRLANNAQNNRNVGLKRSNTSGLKGASWDARRQTWRAAIRDGSTTRHLGRYATPEEAHAAYCRAAERLHGEFARTA